MIDNIVEYCYDSLFKSLSESEALKIIKHIHLYLGNHLNSILTAWYKKHYSIEDIKSFISSFTKNDTIEKRKLYKMIKEIMLSSTDFINEILDQIQYIYYTDKKVMTNDEFIELFESVVRYKIRITDYVHRRLGKKELLNRYNRTKYRTILESK